MTSKMSSHSHTQSIKSSRKLKQGVKDLEKTGAFLRKEKDGT